MTVRHYRTNPMTTSAKTVALLMVAVSVGAISFWVLRRDERQIYGQLLRVNEFNGAAGNQSDTATRATRIGQYFTRDVIIEFGDGRATIQGRETLVSMATRLLPRTSGYAAQLADTEINVVDSDRADVSVTLVLRSRAPDFLEIDPRELSIFFQNIEGGWRIRHVKLVSPFR
jgi:SnoaL-like domain